MLVDDLLKTETDQKLIEKLMEYRFDASLEGSEEEKNAALSPALPIPELDKEVLMAQGKRIGMAPILQDTVPKSDVVPAQEPPVSRTPAPERRPGPRTNSWDTTMTTMILTRCSMNPYQ